MSKQDVHQEDRQQKGENEGWDIKEKWRGSKERRDNLDWEKAWGGQKTSTCQG